MKDLKTTFFLLFCATLISLGVWLSIVFNNDPSISDPITIAAFFGSLFLWMTGFISFVFIYIGSAFFVKTHGQIPYKSFIHASIISAAGVFVLVLQTMRVLGWLEFIIVFLIVLLLEIYLKYKKGNH